MRSSAFIVLSLFAISCNKAVTEESFFGEWSGRYVMDQGLIEVYKKQAKMDDKQLAEFEYDLSQMEKFESKFTLNEDHTFEMVARKYAIEGTWSFQEPSIVLDIEVWNGLNFNKLVKDPKYGFKDEPVRVNISEKNEVLTFIAEYGFQLHIRFKRRTVTES